MSAPRVMEKVRPAIKPIAGTALEPTVLKLAYRKSDVSSPSRATLKKAVEIKPKAPSATA